MRDYLVFAGIMFIGTYIVIALLALAMYSATYTYEEARVLAFVMGNAMGFLNMVRFLIMERP